MLPLGALGHPWGRVAWPPKHSVSGLLGRSLPTAKLWPSPSFSNEEPVFLINSEILPRQGGKPMKRNPRSSLQYFSSRDLSKAAMLYIMIGFRWCLSERGEHLPIVLRRGFVNRLPFSLPPSSSGPIGYKMQARMKHESNAIEWSAFCDICPTGQHVSATGAASRTRLGAWHLVGQVQLAAWFRAARGPRTTLNTLK